jgi:hypothetical protein
MKVLQHLKEIVMKRMVSFIIAFMVICVFGFTQSRQTAIGTANLSNGGKLNLMAVREVTSDNMFITPGEGNRFVAFDILIDNSSGNSDIALENVYKCFELKDSNGYSYKSNFMQYDLIKPVLPDDSTLERGDILRGFLTFPILQNAPINSLQMRLKTNSIQSEWIRIR